MNTIVWRVAGLAKYVYTRNRLMSLWIFSLMILVGALEALGIISLIPVIESLSGNPNTSEYSGYIKSFLGSLFIDVTLYHYLCVFAGIVIVKSIFRYFSKKFLLKNQMEVEAGLSQELFQAVLSTSGAYFMHLNEGELLNSLVGEVRKVGDCLYYLYDFLAVLIRFIFYSVVLFSFSFKLSFCIFFLSGLVAAIPLFISKTIHKESGRRVTFTNEIQDFLLQIVNNFSQIKSYSANDFFSEKYNQKVQNYTRIHGKVRLLSDLSSIVFEPLGVGQIILIVFLSLEHFSLPFSEILIILVALRSSVPLLGQMATYFNVVVASSTSFESVLGLLKSSKENKEITDGERIGSVKNEIKVEGLGVRLGGKSILRNLSLSIYKGEFVAIVGSSGSGKSTLVKTLSGFISPSSGTILIDGKPLTSLSLYEWRKLISIVPQLPIIMKGSVEENIAFGENEKDQGRIRSSLEDSELSDFVFNLDDKEKTILGQGRSFSGGQAQRLSIARALYRAPEILILDEPTSSLDSETEKSLLNTFLRVKGEKTIIMVTHDLNLVKNCDRIFVIENGELVESGSYIDLLKRSGRFSEMSI